MPPSTVLPEDEKQDEKNVGQQHADRTISELSGAENRGTINMDDFERNYGENADDSQENENIKKLQDKERSSTPTPNGDNFDKGGWQNNVNSDYSADNKQRAKLWLKKRGPLLGIGGGVGIVGIVFTGFFSGAALPINLMQNITGTNDSSSTSMNRRALKTIQNAMTSSPVECTSVKIKCKMGRISNSALNSLEKKGLKPVYTDELSVTNRNKRIGYPSRNPDAYEIDIDGNKTTVPANELKQFLVDHPKIASKVLGTGGAFNLRIKAWSGKYISSKFNNVFGLKKDGGLADGENTKTAGENYEKKLFERLVERIPGVSKLGEVADSVKAKVEPHLGKAKKAGVAYTLAVASCIGIKAPSYIAAGVAAVQLAQILPIINDVILSPGSKLKSGEGTAQDAEAIGTMLTTQTARKSDGKMTSALDSQYLQAALGINTNKPSVSKDYTPGYSFLTSPIVLGSIKADKKTENACNGIMSPAAMYTALAVDSAITVAASATIVGGILKIAGSFVITEIAVNVTKDLVGDQAKNLLVEMAQNDKIPTAKGQEFGDVAGISAAAYFSANGMGHHLQTLKKSQLSSYKVVKNDDESFQRQMDVASLSPFDTSSKYTFLGSIMNNFTLAAVASGAYSNGALGLLSTVAKMPLSVFSNNTYADSSSLENYCGYADSFGLSLDSEADTPAINMAGLPCTGITEAQAGMSTEQAISLISKQGWLDETKDIADGATIDDLVSSGYIKSGTPLSDYIESCSNAASGDYLFNSASCTIESEIKSTEDIPLSSTCTDTLITNSDGSTTTKHACASGSPDFANNINGNLGVSDGQALEAIPVFLLDFQVIQSINGEDEETGGSSTTQANSNIDMTNLRKDSTSVSCASGTTDAGNETGYDQKVAVPIKLCSIPGTLRSGNPAKVNSRVSGAFLAMINQMRSDLSLETINVSDDFRTMATQELAYGCYKGTITSGCGGYGNSAAAPGTSNHQMGLAIDFKLPTGNSGATKPGDKVWDWLSANASKYGYSSNVGESWHWEVAGT